MDVKDLWKLSTKQLEQLGSVIDVIVDDYDITLDNSDFENKLVSAISRGDSLKGRSNDFGTIEDYNYGIQALENYRNRKQVAEKRKERSDEQQKRMRLLLDIKNELHINSDKIRTYDYYLEFYVDSKNTTYGILLKHDPMHHRFKGNRTVKNRWSETITITCEYNYFNEKFNLTLQFKDGILTLTNRKNIFKEKSHFAKVIRTANLRTDLPPRAK